MSLTVEIYEQNDFQGSKLTFKDTYKTSSWNKAIGRAIAKHYGKTADYFMDCGVYFGTWYYVKTEVNGKEVLKSICVDVVES